MRVVFGLAAVLQVRLCSADAVCSDPQTCSQRTSLMQMKSVNLKQSNDGSMHATLMYFQSFTQNLVDQFEERRARRQRQPILDATAVEGTLTDDNGGTTNDVQSNQARYDKNTLESIREIMGQIKTTLAGALHDNMQRAVDRIAECQLVGDYTGNPLRNSPAYHVGFYEHLADSATPDVAGKKRHERMRKSLTHLDQSSAFTGREAENDNRYMSDMNAWDLKRVSPTATSIHEACWKQSFFPGGLDQTDDIESLWRTSELKRREHKTARTTRQASCFTGDDDLCETYDNFRWYDDNALLKSYPCKYASVESGTTIASAERPDPQTSAFAQSRMGCSGECDAFNGRDGANGGNIEGSITDAETFIPREDAFAPPYLAATTDVEVAEMENCLFKTKAWLEGLYGKYRACIVADENKNSKNACTEQKATCDHKQHDFEIARCWWAVDHDFHCSAYVTCVKEKFEAANCNTLCKDVRAITLRNKADYETGERIQCLLEALFGSVNPNYDPLNYDAAVSGTWPLLPRTTDNEALLNMGGTLNGAGSVVAGTVNNMEGEDETAKWVKWCHSDGSSPFTKTQVLTRFYNSTLNDAPSSLSANPTFAEILDYEKRYFDLRCTGDGNANGPAKSTSRMFGLRLPLADAATEQVIAPDSAGALPAGYDLNPATDLATAKSYGANPRSTASSPLGRGYKECTTGQFYKHPLTSTTVNVADAYNMQNGYYGYGYDSSFTQIPENNQGSTYKQHCNEMALSYMVKYSLELPTQWSSWKADSYSWSSTAWNAADGGHLWHPYHEVDNDRSAGYAGGVLYLTTLARTSHPTPAESTQGTAFAAEYAAGTSLHANAFDCTQLPVPGEKKTCSRSEMLRYPYRGCWVDVYRSDELRAEVPFCDISQLKAGVATSTAQFSHASFFDGVSSVQGVTGNQGCTGSVKTDPSNPAYDSAFVSCEADMSVTNWDSDATGAFYSDIFSHANSIIGTCCTAAVNTNSLNAALATAEVYDQSSKAYKEAIPDPALSSTTAADTAYSQYTCEGKYMFTHAEREAAFGSDREIGHNYYSDTSNAFGGYNSGDTGNAQGYWYKNSDYASTLQSLSGAQKYASGDTYAATTTDSTLQTKNEWSISSDIQGIYKVVASTDILGTECSLRSDSSETIKNEAVTGMAGNTYDTA